MLRKNWRERRNGSERGKVGKTGTEIVTERDAEIGTGTERRIDTGTETEAMIETGRGTVTGGGEVAPDLEIDGVAIEMTMSKL